MLWCLLLVYSKQVYATCFDLYLRHHQANSIKQTMLLAFSCSNMHPYYAIFVAVIISEYILINVNK
jgi:hypothetical protein